MLTDVDGKTAFHWTANNPDDGTVKTLLVGYPCHQSLINDITPVISL